MNKIKFRGKGIANNDYCYGIGYADGVIFDPVGRNTIRYHVYPESVTQLIGYDSNGHEIYEGDILVDKQGYKYVALLQPSVEWEREKEIGAPSTWRGMPLAFTMMFTELVLKK